MKWNWQHKDWPNFIFNPKAFLDDENQFLHNAGLAQGTLKSINSKDEESLRVTLLSEEAYKTSEIEGELLNRDSLQSSIRRHFGLKTDRRRVASAEQGISDMLVNLYQTYDQTLSHQMLFDWHQMLTNGRRDLVDVGRYRTHDEPMQIVSGPIHRPKIHFEAPPSQIVSKEMDSFIRWYNRCCTQADNNNLPLIVRAGIAHIYFESIHPFEDGNGRIGRAISEKALSQGLKRPTLIALAQCLQRTRKTYYSALNKGSIGLDIQEWLEFFSKVVLDAQDYTQRMLDFLVEKGQFYNRYKMQFNERQAKVIGRLFDAGIDGFKGGLSAENYIAITGTSRATATRDLQRLVELGALTKKGERRYTRYYLNIAKKEMSSF